MWHERVIKTATWLMRLWGYRSRFVPTSLGEMHVLERSSDGPLPPMVFLHGLSASAVELAPVLRPLRPHLRRVTAVDLPGHGLSARPAAFNCQHLSTAFAEILDDVIDEPAILFGNSMGGMAAIQYASRRPERVRALVLSSPGGARLGESALRGLFASFQVRTRADARAFLAKVYARPPWYLTLAEHLVHARLREPRLHQFLAQVHDTDLLRPDELAALRMPVLMIWGKADRLLDGEHCAFFKRHLPAHAVVVEPDGFAHCPFMEQPGAFAAIVLDFLRSLDAPAVPAA